MENRSAPARAPITVDCRPAKTTAGQGRLHVLFEAAADEPLLAQVARAVAPLACPGTRIYDRARLVRLLVEDVTGDEVERVVAKALEIIPTLEIRASCRALVPSRV